MRKLVSALLVALAPVAAQASVVVDGNLFTTPTEWNIDKATLKASGGVSYVVEDYFYGTPNPGEPYGGQAYDAEALYMQVQGGTLYIGMITGYNPADGDYAPGDFLFDFGQDGTKDYALVVNNTNFNYAFDDVLGSTDPLAGRGLLDVGGLYKITNQNQLFKTGTPGNPLVGLNCGGVPGPQFVATYDCASNPQNSSNLADVAITLSNESLGADPSDSPWVKHYMWEVAIDVSEFGADWGQSFSLSWTMYCGNDVIEIPAPGTLALAGLSLLGLGAARRRKQK